MDFIQVVLSILFVKNCVVRSVQFIKYFPVLRLNQYQTLEIITADYCVKLHSTNACPMWVWGVAAAFAAWMQDAAARLLTQLMLSFADDETDSSVSTSGCSSLLPHVDRADHKEKIAKSNLEQLSGEFYVACIFNAKLVTC